jgi:ubiquinone/menaquinone biosynthesis C-methylase UbiE
MAALFGPRNSKMPEHAPHCVTKTWELKSMSISDKFAKADPKGFYGAKDQDQLTERYDEAAEVYDAAMENDVGWTGHVELAKVVIKHVPPKKRLCDAGAGTGMLGDKLFEAGFGKMSANDLSPGMLAVARKKRIYQHCQVLELGKPLPYPGFSFDAVTACGVFTPNHAPASSLDELIRITKKGGLLLYTLRSDEEPPEFASKQQELMDAGKWELVEAGEPFPSIAAEPHIRHRCWVWRVL